MHSANVSVVIPCYRCAATIGRAVESVARQTAIPREIILVDDGSRDETQKTLEDLVTQYGKDWISIVSKEKNCGVSSARNSGWDVAKSDYVAFLDADDIWHPQKIEIQYSWMFSHPDVPFCGHRSFMVDPSSRADMSLFQHLPSVQLLSKRRLLVSNPFVTPSIMLQRNLPYRFDSTQRYTEDFLLIMQVGLDGHSVAIIEAELACIFKVPGKTGASNDIWSMRAGDLNNYRKLWLSGRIHFAIMFMLILFSVFKFVCMLVIGAKWHFALKLWLKGKVDKLKAA